MKKFLQGRWLGHPLHPVLVHLPVGLWPTAFVLDIISIAVGSALAVKLSFWALVLGLLVAVLAIPAGRADWWDIPRGDRARRIGITHLSLNMMVIILVVMNIILRLDSWSTATSVAIWSALLSGTTIILLGISGYLGGQMVYTYGASIPRHVTRLRQTAQAGHANVPVK